MEKRCVLLFILSCQLSATVQPGVLIARMTSELTRLSTHQQLATLRSNDYFGQYGKISKLILHKRPSLSTSPTTSSSPPNIGIYITYVRREDAARAITALDGFPSPSTPGQVLRASYGTMKYCEAWLRGGKCEKLASGECLGLHDWGDERDCFTKEDLSTLSVLAGKRTWREISD